MLPFWHHHGILGINARNLLYIKPFNTEEGISFADNKIKTKQFLSARGIKTAKLLAKIKSEEELSAFSWESLPNDFVLKPNAGYGGEGILLISGREIEGGFRRTTGEFISCDEMNAHIKDILDGRYAITGTLDFVLFEERLKPHPDLKQLSEFGLPDIRIIVYNLVPVMAMVRVPTKKSGGKANLHAGGIGLGIDLAKGEIITKAESRFKGTKIPFWDDILLLSSEIQQKTTLGYLAVDIVVDEEKGPTLLEINARAGLNVQIANLAPLRERLDKVAGIKVQSPDKGVRIAKDLFGNKMERRVQVISGKTIIGMEDDLTLNLKHGMITIKARMNPSMNKNYLKETLFLKIAEHEPMDKLTLRYSLRGIRGKAVFYPLAMEDLEAEALVGKKILSNFLLDVGMPGKTRSSLVKSPHQKAEDNLLIIDRTLFELSSKLSLISRVLPLNLEEEKERFFAESEYEPQFKYKKPSPDLLAISSELQKLSFETQSPLGELLEEKRRELILKAALVSAIGDDEAFQKNSEAFFGIPQREIIKKSESRIAYYVSRITYNGIKRENNESQGPTIFDNLKSSEQTAETLRTILIQRGLQNWKVHLKRNMAARACVGRNNTLFIREGEMFSEEDLNKLIAHEIETHVYCAENGKRQPYLLFVSGFANALKTQEGLAIFNQCQTIENGDWKAVLGFQAAMWGRNLGFRALFDKLSEFLDKQKAWNFSIKAKRGFSDTGKEGSFLKNAMYFWGYCDIKAYLEHGGLFSDLYLGKISFEKLPLIKKLPGLKEAMYVSERLAFSV